MTEFVNRETILTPEIVKQNCSLEKRVQNILVRPPFRQEKGSKKAKTTKKRFR